MCDKELLVSYLYDELQGSERKVFQHHLASCRECQDEVQGLRATRAHLMSWAPPEPVLGLQVSDRDAGRRFRIPAAWGLAAAAALVLAAASAIANVEVRYADGGVTIRTGWAPEASPPGATVSAAASREDLAAVQQRIRELEAELAARGAAPLTTTPATFTDEASRSANSLTDAELLRRVRQWISESEKRQEQLFATRFVQGMRELQAAHSMDHVRLEQAINQHQGAWSDEVYRQREELKQVFRLVNAQQR